MAIEILEVVAVGLAVLAIAAFLFPSGRVNLALRLVILAITGLAGADLRPSLFSS